MKAKLLVVRGQPQGKCLVFPLGEFVIGRGTECHVRPNSSWVSRQHCLLRVTEKSMHLRDLGSTNGTLINGARLIGERPLSHGDQLQVGPLVFEVCLEDEALAAKAPGQVETGAHYIDTAQVQALAADASVTAPAQDHIKTDAELPEMLAR